MNDWILEETGFSDKLRSGREALYTVGNGYICARGFFEETQTGLLSLGGIYAAGVYGKAEYKPWRGEGRELVNISNIFSCKILIDGEPVEFNGNTCCEYSRCLDMRSATLYRSYVFKSRSGKQVRLEFERFVSMADKHISGQKVTITSAEDAQIELTMGINHDIKNLNLVSSEPLPIQPGRKHIFKVNSDCESLVTSIDEDLEKAILHLQSVNSGGWTQCSAESDEVCGTRFKGNAKAKSSYCFEKLVFTDCEWNNCESTSSIKAKFVLKTYDVEYKKHKSALERLWENSDIEIQGSIEDQQIARYNILQLMQSCPWHDETQSIGARGLTGEMYEGCIFWDTEIFMLPFFTLTQPEQAKRLLMFRYHTLDEAKIHAQSNRFSGAMYPWQCSEKGIEQTPQGVGAFYSIHIIADIAYALLHYYRSTGDKAFFERYGLEILLETAKFWLSRVTWDDEFERYNILAVRGPNEYDVIVNNNFYTNFMAKENLTVVSQVMDSLKQSNQPLYSALMQKTGTGENELRQMEAVAQLIYICYDEKRKLYLEDDMYCKRVPVDMKSIQPTAKRIIDTTIPYEALMLYQISKQADVLHLMNLFPHRFTKEQKQAAWDYYVPKTAHDSSLSYSQHSIMASTLGKSDTAYEFFKVSARLDIDDVQLNTVSGLHFANFGGTYQAVVYGMCGITVDDTGISISPSLPDGWSSVKLTVYSNNTAVRLCIQNDSVEARIKEPAEVKLKIFGEDFTLNSSVTPLTAERK